MVDCTNTHHHVRTGDAYMHLDCNVRFISHCKLQKLTPRFFEKHGLYHECSCSSSEFLNKFIEQENNDILCLAHVSLHL